MEFVHQDSSLICLYFQATNFLISLNIHTENPCHQCAAHNINMSPKTQAIFVAGASGNQASAVALALLSAGHAVRALVRDPSKPTSQSVAAKGTVLLTGDFSNPPALSEAATYSAGVFINVPPTFPQDEELKHIQNIVAASLSVGIKTCILSTVTRAEK